MYFGTKPYGLEEYMQYHGDGSNLYRRPFFGQPRTLREGDVLANGLVVGAQPFEGSNGSIVLNFTNGSRRLVAARLPLQLQSDEPGVLPAQLHIGQILRTGDVVLSKPQPLDPVEWHDYQDEIEIHITGGRYGHKIGVPSDMPLAVYDEMYPPNGLNRFGAFVIERTLEMDEAARVNLPRLGQLALEI